MILHTNIKTENIMIIEYIRYKLPQEDHKQFIDALEKACIILKNYPDCLNYQLAQCSEDKDLFTWRIEWTSIDRHINGFRKSKEFADFFSLVKPFFNSIQEMNHYEVII
jgi:quinol monooxygenase YgiN